MEDNTEYVCGETQGKFTDVFKPMLHGTSFDNGFVVTIDYKCLGDKSDKQKKCVIEQKAHKDVASMLKTEFFVDLTQNGPLYISNVHYASSNSKSAYTVHESFAKGLHGISEVFSRLNYSFVQRLAIDLKFTEGGKHAARLGELLTQLARKCHIKVAVVENIHDGGEKIELGLDATTTDVVIERFKAIFSDRRSQTYYSVGDAFQGVYVSNDSGLEQATGDINIACLAYRNGRYAKAKLTKKNDASSYVLRFDEDDKEMIALANNITETSEYKTTQSILLKGVFVMSDDDFPVITDGNSQCHGGKRHTKNSMGLYTEHTDNPYDYGYGYGSDDYQRKIAMKKEREKSALKRQDEPEYEATSNCSLL